MPSARTIAFTASGITLTIRSSVRTIGERFACCRSCGEAARLRFLALVAGVAPVAPVGAGPTIAGVPNTGLGEPVAGRAPPAFGRRARFLFWGCLRLPLRLPVRGTRVGPPEALGVGAEGCGTAAGCGAGVLVGPVGAGGGTV